MAARDWPVVANGRAAPAGGQGPHRYLLISSDPRRLSDLVTSLSAQPAEVTTTYPGGADRHRILALRPDVVLLHIVPQELLEQIVDELRGWRSVSPTPVLAF